MKKNNIKIVENCNDLPDQLYEDIGYCHDIFFKQVYELLNKYDQLTVLNSLGCCFANVIFEFIDKEILEEYTQSASLALKNAIRNKIAQDKKNETKTS